MTDAKMPAQVLSSKNFTHLARPAKSSNAFRTKTGWPWAGDSIVPGYPFKNTNLLTALC